MEEFDSIWESLGFSAKEAANLDMRSDLMRSLEQIVRSHHWTQAEAARRCGISQPRMNDLLRGRLHKFSLDALVNMATALGQRVELHLKAA